MLDAFRVGVSNFVIPVSYVKIHAACTPAGETILEDEEHLSLPLGQHHLCIQAFNQDDVALQGPGMMRMIDVTIQAVD
jgi:hypothetical protein